MAELSQKKIFLLMVVAFTQLDLVPIFTVETLQYD